MESARKHKMPVDLESINLPPLLSHNSLAECFTKKKNKQHFHHDVAGGRTGLVVRASDSGSGDPGSILGRVGVLFP